MQKFIISVKDKITGRDVISPYIVNSLDDLGNYSERISPLGLIVIVDSIKEENNFVELEDDDVMTVAEAKKATQAMVQQFSSAINELQFLVQHPDYHQLVGTPQQLGEPLKQAILKNPQIMMEIRQSPNPMLTAYNYAKMASMQQQTTVNPAAAAAIQAATRPGSASMVANGGAFNAASRFAAMSDEEFARFEAEILSRG